VSLIDNLEDLLRTGRDDAMLRFGLGNAYLQNKDYPKAIEHLRAAVRHDAEYSAAWKLLGKALSLDNQTGQAVDTYQHGIEAAERQGDKQAVKEMQVFLNRLLKQRAT
jgi:Tfp pilus assembly protein PilF